jgi:hypothetical protein
VHGRPAVIETTRRLTSHGVSRRCVPAQLLSREAILATRSRPTRQKHDRERARQQKQKDKAIRRQVAKEQPRVQRVAGAEDPDIAGIRPGPQPKPWNEEDLVEEGEEE